MSEGEGFWGEERGEEMQRGCGGCKWQGEEGKEIGNEFSGSRSLKKYLTDGQNRGAFGDVSCEPFDSTQGT
jgi:hypothetical protein